MNCALNSHQLKLRDYVARLEFSARKINHYGFNAEIIDKHISTYRFNAVPQRGIAVYVKPGCCVCK